MYINLVAIAAIATLGQAEDDFIQLPKDDVETSGHKKYLRSPERNSQGALTLQRQLEQTNAGNWKSNWNNLRFLENAFDVDPEDNQSMLRGRGTIKIGDGLAIFNGSPRLYISADADVSGWENVEMTAFGKYEEQGAEPLKVWSGLTMATRMNHAYESLTNHHAESPCDAFGYFARIYQESGECSFQKKYYHSTERQIHTNTNRVPCFDEASGYPNGLPLKQWIGMKFKVTTLPGGRVLLELYVDPTGTGDNFELKHSMIDYPGMWMPSGFTWNEEYDSLEMTPHECTQNDGDPVLRPGNVSFLQTDGRDESTEVHWRDFTIVNSLADQESTCPSGVQRDNVCCAESCGTCGGYHCQTRPGGASNCCMKYILRDNERSCAWYPPPCVTSSLFV